ncbi:SIR2 family protein [Fusobacterium sp.]|uniref:SIR2 family protein n=1 Tax=Fusobacterium sp. TaxID=68766 RepID=UPI00260A1569|nr:SIR2 family protein [Fusobacterium sp.]
MSFFEKLDLEKKLNICTGSFFEKSNGFPSRDGLVEILTNQIKFKNVKNFNDRHSLFEVSQSFVDSVIGTKQSLYRRIQGIYEYKKDNNNYLDTLIEAGLVGAVINTNYDSSIEENINVKKITPYDKESFTDGKIRLYKVLGDLNNYENCAITEQDFRRLKVLPFYEVFWESIRYELKLRSTIFLGVDFDDSDFFKIFDFILSKNCEDIKPIYMITSNSILNPKVMEFFNKHNIKVLASTEHEFFKELKNYTKNENINLSRLFPEMYSELMNEKKFQW